MPPTATIPDPISDPQGYQRHLLSLLGDDDPAEVQAVAPAVWTDLVAEAGPLAGRRPEPREWSVIGCLAHALDAEIVMSARYRWILAHDEPPLIGYDQDLWADRLHGDPDDPDELLAVLRPLRGSNIALWRGSTPEQRARAGLHAERGPETFELCFRMIAGHDRFHQAQARRALDALRDV
jgi:hypothetical protein